MLEDGAPLFSQIAERLTADIADGTLAEGDRVPSTNELAAFYRINPATAAKGINVLADDGLVEKRRGIGMFVAAGARDRLLEERRKRFAERYIEPMIAEATRLRIDTNTLISMVRESESDHAQHNDPDHGPQTESDHAHHNDPDHAQHESEPSQGGIKI